MHCHYLFTDSDNFRLHEQRNTFRVRRLAQVQVLLFAPFTTPMSPPAPMHPYHSFLDFSANYPRPHRTPYSAQAFKVRQQHHELNATYRALDSDCPWRVYPHPNLSIRAGDTVCLIDQRIDAVAAGTIGAPQGCKKQCVIFKVQSHHGITDHSFRVAFHPANVRSAGVLYQAAEGLLDHMDF